MYMKDGKFEIMDNHQHGTYGGSSVLIARSPSDNVDKFVAYLSGMVYP